METDLQLVGDGFDTGVSVIVAEPCSARLTTGLFIFLFHLDQKYLNWFKITRKIGTVEKPAATFCFYFNRNIAYPFRLFFASCPFNVIWFFSRFL